MSRKNYPFGTYIKNNFTLCFLLFFYMYLLLAVLGPCCCPRAFSGCGKWALLSSYSGRASHLSSFSRCGAQALGHASFSSCSSQNLVLVHRFSCSVAYGIFLDKGSNPCLLHWQKDSLPLIHQGDPTLCFLNTYFLKNKEQ